MNKLYNDNDLIVKELLDFFAKIDFNLTKPQSKVLPNLLSSIILSENITTADISKTYVDDSFLTNDSSIQKKIWRFLNNPKFDDISSRLLVVFTRFDVAVLISFFDALIISLTSKKILFKF